MKPLVLTRLTVHDFRNLKSVEIGPSSQANILYGDNGQGKTSLLEAIYLALTTRSFRTHRHREMILHGASAGSAKLDLMYNDVQRQQLVVVATARKSFKLDGQVPSSIAYYAVQSPVVVFHPGELALTMGPAVHRRTLLDRIALFLEPMSHTHVAAYARAMKARQRLLRVSGPAASGVEAYEQLMAQHGAHVVGFRATAAERLFEQARVVFAELAPDGLCLAARYACAGTDQPEQMMRKLYEGRPEDARRASAGFGPHHDDVIFQLNGHSARATASQGQHRLLTLALKVAETSCIVDASGKIPVLLLDDVSSELDAGRTDALFRLLGERKNQVFVTTTRRQMLVGFEMWCQSGRLFHVHDGAITRVTS